MNEIIITEENFDKTVLNSTIPVLLDFWATWCGPCKMLAPILSQIAEEREGTLIVGKVNVDEQPVLAESFGITSIPTLILFNGGVATSKMIGLRPKAQIEDMLR